MTDTARKADYWAMGECGLGTMIAACRLLFLSYTKISMLYDYNMLYVSSQSVKN